MSTRQTRGFHPWRYILFNSSNNAYKFSFLPNTIPIWNSLPLEVVSAPNPPPSAAASLHCRCDRFLIHCTVLYCILFATPVFIGLNITTLFITSTFYFPPCPAHVTHTAYYNLSEGCSLFTIRRRTYLLILTQ